MKMRVIILGYTSFVGRNLSDYFSKNVNVELVRVGRKDCGSQEVIQFEVPKEPERLDSAISSLVRKLEINRKSVVINCISMGDVDECEANRTQCDITNFQFVKKLYTDLAKLEFQRFIHLSTNAVYGGEAPSYHETSECSPVNFYGVTKFKTDAFLLQCNDERVTVARPITMYGKALAGGRANPVSMIVKKLINEEKVKLVDDVYVNILYVGDLVATIGKIIDVSFSGLVNISGDDIYSRYELGLELAALLQKDTGLIEAVTSKEFKTVAQRPRDTSFDNSLMKSLGVEPRTLKQVISKLMRP